MDAYVMEAIKSILLAMVVIGILLAVVYFFWRYKDKIIRSLFPKETKDATILNQLDNLRRRIEKLEEAERPKERKNSAKSHEFQKDRGEKASLLSDFFIEMADLCTKYIKKLEAGKEDIRPRETCERVSMPTSSETIIKKSYGPLTDTNLHDWWKREGHNRFSDCKKSLEKEFGNVTVEVIKSHGEEWNIMAVSNDGSDFYILPRRRSLWDDRVYQDLFSLEERASVREGVPIKSLKFPLPKAKKDYSGWHLMGNKGKISTKESDL